MAAFGFIRFLPALFLSILLRFQSPDKPANFFEGILLHLRPPELLRYGGDPLDEGAAHHHPVGKPGKAANLLAPGDPEADHRGNRRIAPYRLQKSLDIREKSVPFSRGPQG